MNEQLAQERLHAELAEERLRRVQEVSDLRIQFAEKQASRQTNIVDPPVNVSVHQTAQKYRVHRKFQNLRSPNQVTKLILI